jgi:hypothetical protein
LNESYLTYTVFDDNHQVFLYSLPQVSHQQEDFDVSTLDLTDAEYLDGTYWSLLFQTSAIPSHHYHQLLLSLEMLCNAAAGGGGGMPPLANILVYDTDENGFYHGLNSFVLDKFLRSRCAHAGGDTPALTGIRHGVVYKVKRLMVSVQMENNENHIYFYQGLLNDVIPAAETKLKYYNLKLMDAASEEFQKCWSQNRSFIGIEETRTCLESAGYKPLDTTQEYSKLCQVRNASFLILNWGGNHIINAHYASAGRNMPILVLCHHSYKNEYFPLQREPSIRFVDTRDFGNRVRYVFDVPDQIENLQEIIDDFENFYLATSISEASVDISSLPTDFIPGHYLALNPDLVDFQLRMTHPPAPVPEPFSFAEDEDDEETHPNRRNEDAY